MKPDKIKIKGPIQLMGSFTVPSEDTDAEQRRFEMLAYTGAAVEVGFGIPTVFDLADMNVKEGKLAILLQHDPDRRVGFGEAVENDGLSLSIKGRFLENDYANEVIADSKQGFPWQASVGLAPSRAQFIDEGVELEINGQQFTGPLLKVSSTLRESSFVSMGADGDTSAVALSASAESNQYELEVEMSGNDSKPTADKTGASANELRAAFPDDLDFVLDCVEAGLSIDQASVKYLPIVQAKHAAQLAAKEQEFTARIEAQKAERPNNPPVLTGRGSASEGAEISATQRWNKLVNAEIDRGKPRHKAVSIVASRNPDLNKAMVLEANQGRSCYVPTGFQS